MSKWSVRYDIMRRSPGERPDWASCCCFGEQLGFSTVGEANDMLKLIRQAAGELDLHQTYDVWPFAVHEDHGTMNFNLTGEEDDGDGESNDNKN